MLRPRLASFLLAAGAMLLGALLPLDQAQAQEAGVTSPPVSQDGYDIVGHIESQVNILNSGSPGSGGPPPTCTWTDQDAGPDGEDVERHDGTPRWRDPGQGHQYWEESVGDPAAEGLIFRYECWHPDMGCRTPAPATEGCLGEVINETFCGSFLCEFDAVNPPNLAQLAVDEFVRTLGPPQAAFSPSGETLVNFPTYMWIPNAPETDEITPEPMSVPGVTVITTASLSDVTWDMGDGESRTCLVTRSEQDAIDKDCSYLYQTSSYGQPGLAYAGEVSMTYAVEWTVTEGPGISGSLDAPRSGGFALAVAEAQALNTD